MPCELRIKKPSSVKVSVRHSSARSRRDHAGDVNGIGRSKTCGLVVRIDFSARWIAILWPSGLPFVGVSTRRLLHDKAKFSPLDLRPALLSQIGQLGGIPRPAVLQRRKTPSPTDTECPNSPLRWRIAWFSRSQPCKAIRKLIDIRSCKLSFLSATPGACPPRRFLRIDAIAANAGHANVRPVRLHLN
jgi:hypothetical protein